MSTGSGFFGGEPGAGDEPNGSGRGPGYGQEEDGTFADVLNGFTLDSGRGRRKRKKRKESRGDADVDEQLLDETSAPHPTDQGDHVIDVASPPDRSEAYTPSAGGLFDSTYDETGFSQSEPEPGFGDFAQVQPAEQTGFVRPYAITGGRTKANHSLELETLISTNTGFLGFGAPAATDQIELRSIVEECRSPRSVAEVAAILRVPLGVARVLISDAADADLIIVHKTVSGSDGAEAHLMLMERVLSGLRRL
jgi:hypothetical protein